MLFWIFFLLMHSVVGLRGMVLNGDERGVFEEALVDKFFESIPGANGNVVIESVKRLCGQQLVSSLTLDCLFKNRRWSLIVVGSKKNAVVCQCDILVNDGICTVISKDFSADYPSVKIASEAIARDSRFSRGRMAFCCALFGCCLYQFYSLLARSFYLFSLVRSLSAASR